MQNARPNSQAIYAKACGLIPGGVNSPVRACKGLLSPPMIVRSGLGAILCDADGREYIDYCMSWGALILGHAHPAVVDAASRQMRQGSSFGIATELEVELAEKIIQSIPSIEKIRLVSSGTEATMTAIRLARGYTERTHILKFSGHYHGHADALLIAAGSGVASLNPIATSKGINPSTIQDTICLPFNDFAALDSFFLSDPRAGSLAAVILEPITGNMGVVLPEPGFLEHLRKRTKEMGALLIFDEVITGFRVGSAGAQGIYQIDPDLTCLGKVIGGGFPLAAIGGKRNILDHLAPFGQVYQAGTLSGNPVAATAGLTTLQQIGQEGFYSKLEQKTERLLGPIQKAIDQTGANISIQKAASMFTLFFGVKKVRSKEDLKHLDEKAFTLLFQTLFDRGIYIPPSPHEAWFISSAHTDEQLDKSSHEIASFIYSRRPDA